MKVIALAILVGACAVLYGASTDTNTSKTLDLKKTAPKADSFDPEAYARKKLGWPEREADLATLKTPAPLLEAFTDKVLKSSNGKTSNQVEYHAPAASTTNFVDRWIAILNDPLFQALAQNQKNTVALMFYNQVVVSDPDFLAASDEAKKDVQLCIFSNRLDPDNNLVQANDPTLYKEIAAAQEEYDEAMRQWTAKRAAAARRLGIADPSLPSSNSPTLNAPIRINGIFSADSSSDTPVATLPHTSTLPAIKGGFNDEQIVQNVEALRERKQAVYDQQRQVQKQIATLEDRLNKTPKVEEERSYTSIRMHNFKIGYSRGNAITTTPRPNEEYKTLMEQIGQLRSIYAELDAQANAYEVEVRKLQNALR